MLRSDATIFMLQMCDVLVDGPFILEKKDLRLPFRGSSNQRVIDLQKTIGEGCWPNNIWNHKIVLSEYGNDD